MASIIREIAQIRTPEGSMGLNWLWFDIDVNGVFGGKDAILFVVSGSLQSVQWLDYEGDEANLWLSRQGKFPHGPFSDTIDSAGHYPWAGAIGRRHANAIFMGFGSTGATQIRRRVPTDSFRAQINLTKYNRGLSVQNGSDPIGPSFWPSTGSAGMNFLGGPTTEQLDAMTVEEILAYLNAGGRGNTPRNFTLANASDYKYAIKCVSIRGLSDLTPDADDAPPPPPSQPLTFSVGGAPNDADFAFPGASPCRFDHCAASSRGSPRPLRPRPLPFSKHRC